MRPKRRAATILAVALLLCSALVTRGARANAHVQVPALPDGAQTHWVVSQPHEIVTYMTFDPASVERQRPPTLRFITVKELAAIDVRWATDYLAEHPTHGRWGVSFVEIVRMGTFMIDGRAPKWPAHGAAGLWCARVAPSDASADLGPGRPLLVMEFWMPDRAYAAYMRSKGHYATYGDVQLEQDVDGIWRGSVEVAGLEVVAQCKPTGAVTGGAGSAGMQILFPPLSSAIDKIVRVAFAGHREQECGDASSWQFRGAHPLAGGVVLRPSVIQAGYELTGGVYSK
jgi:hypothetical protein